MGNRYSYKELNILLEDAKQMHDYYQQGHNLKQVAHEFELTIYMLRTVFKKHGLLVRPPSRKPNDIQETLMMYEDYKHGYSFKDLSKKYCFLPNSIYHRFVIAGLEIRNAYGKRRTTP